MPPKQWNGTASGGNVAVNGNVDATNRRTPRRNLPQKANGFLYLGLRELKAQGKRPAHIGSEIPLVALDPLVPETRFKRSRRPKKGSCNGKRTYPHCPQAKTRRMAAAARRKAKEKKVA